MKWVTLLAFLAVPLLLPVLFRWLTRRFGRHDAVIDEMIKANTATFREGMETVDWHKVNRSGGRAWATVLRSQRKQPRLRSEPPESAQTRQDDPRVH